MKKKITAVCFLSFPRDLPKSLPDASRTSPFSLILPNSLPLASRTSSPFKRPGKRPELFLKSSPDVRSCSFPEESRTLPSVPNLYSNFPLASLYSEPDSRPNNFPDESRKSWAFGSDQKNSRSKNSENDIFMVMQLQK